MNVFSVVFRKNTQVRWKCFNPDDPRHIFAESFSSVRSSLLYSPYEGARPKTILVTSGVPNEGKSTIATNLATTLAIGGARTLLVDADLRRGSTHETFDLPNEPGFSEILTQGLPWRDALRATSIQNLTLIPRGKALHHPSKYLLGGNVEIFLKEIYGEYDFIIFDSCPVLAADDTTTFAPKLDGVIFVVRLSLSSVKSSKQGLDLLKERQVNVLGVVLNAVDAAIDGYDYYGYAEYYHTTT